MLTAGDIIRVQRKGRERWNHLNPDPIKSICNAWVARHIDGIQSSAAKLKQIAEERTEQ